MGKNQLGNVTVPLGGIHHVSGKVKSINGLHNLIRKKVNETLGFTPSYRVKSIRVGGGYTVWVQIEADLGQLDYTKQGGES